MERDSLAGWVASDGAWEVLWVAGLLMVVLERGTVCVCNNFRSMDGKTKSSGPNYM